MNKIQPSEDTLQQQQPITLTITFDKANAIEDMKIGNQIKDAIDPLLTHSKPRYRSESKGKSACYMLEGFTENAMGVIETANQIAERTPSIKDISIQKPQGLTT